MKQLTPKQNQRIRKIATIVKSGNLGIAQYLFELEDRLEEDIPKITDVISRLQGEQGEPGKDAAVDYDFIISKVKKSIPSPKDGLTPFIDYRKIVDEVLGKIPKPKDGETPPVNYPFIVNEVLRKMPQVRDGLDGSPDTSEDIRNKLELLFGDERLDIKHIKGIETLADNSRLIELERMVRTSAEALPSTTTHFFNSGAFIGRAKNINFIQGTDTTFSMNVRGDTANITLPQGGSGTGGGAVQKQSPVATADPKTFTLSTAVSGETWGIMDSDFQVAGVDYTVASDGSSITYAATPPTNLAGITHWLYYFTATTPSGNYLTDGSGIILTDSSGTPLTVT